MANKRQQPPKQKQPPQAAGSRQPKGTRQPKDVLIVEEGQVASGKGPGTRLNRSGIPLGSDPRE